MTLQTNLITADEISDMFDIPKGSLGGFMEHKGMPKPIAKRRSRGQKGGMPLRLWNKESIMAWDEDNRDRKRMSAHTKTPPHTPRPRRAPPAQLPALEAIMQAPEPKDTAVVTVKAEGIFIEQRIPRGMVAKLLGVILEGV